MSDDDETLYVTASTEPETPRKEALRRLARFAGMMRACARDDHARQVVAELERAQDWLAAQVSGRPE